jgi:alcohol dehydrogenase class IV
MRLWNIQTPAKVAVGRGSISLIPDMIGEMKLKRIFTLIDPNLVNTEFGLRVQKILLPYSNGNFSSFTTNPTFQQAEAGLKEFNTGNHDGFIVIGGGSAIDIAKIIALSASNEGFPKDFLVKKEGLIRPTPIIAVPTTCGTGAESSPFAIITDTFSLRKRGIDNPLMIPSIVILDCNSLLSLSNASIAATGIDCLSHLIESHISGNATPLSMINSKGLLYGIRSILELSAFDKDIKALEKLQATAFMARLLYPRTGLTIAHALSHPLGAHTNIHHGLAVATFLEESLHFNYPSCQSRIKEIEYCLELKSNNNSLLTWLNSFLVKSGIAETISIHLSQFANLPIEKMAEDALSSSNVPSNPRPISIGDINNIILRSFKKYT